MKRLLTITLLLAITSMLLAQSERILKEAFEGKRVEVLIEMPATSQGINLYMDRSQPMDFEQYSNRIKDTGIALHPGDKVMITKIKKKRKHIEVQLAGGGYGTFGDESAYVTTETAEKTSREKELDQILSQSNVEASRRKKLEEERAALIRERERLQARYNQDANFQSEMKQSRIEQKRLQGGSRFNIKYADNVTPDQLTVESIRKALREYISFDTSRSSTATAGTTSSSDGMLSKGMTLNDVVARFGLPDNLNTTKDCGIEITTGEFESNNQVINAIFAEKILVKYTVSSK